MKPRLDFDVVIVGGGMVGAALAALLGSRPATAPLKVALIEPGPPDAPAPGEPLDLRVSAFSPASCRLLAEVGAWPAVARRGAGAYERMLVWDGAAAPDGPDTLVFDAAEEGTADLGHVLENRAVAAALVDAAVAHGAVLLASPATGLELEPDLARVVTAERRLATRLVVAADGVDSRLRGYAGIAGAGAAYPQEAVVAHLVPSVPHARAARQRFLPTGPIALLPLADGRVSLVWSTTPAEAADLVAALPEAFSRRVTAASDGVLGDLTLASGRGRFPLRRFQAERYHATRCVLVGDAAHAVHPLAGQGVNQGLQDVLALARELGAARAGGADIGDARALGRYARERRAENLAMGAALHGIWRLFGDVPAPLRRLRSLGLGLVDRAPPLKRLLVRRALGA